MNTPLFQFIVPGDPIAKARPRVYGRHAVTPQRTLNAENRVYTEFRNRYPDAQPTDKPIRLDVEFWMPRRGRPDLDNLLKLVMDALNGVAYRDDQQIMQINARKLTPDEMVPGKRGMRKRHSGDPCTWHGIQYSPVTIIGIHLIEDHPTTEKENQQ